MKKLLLLVSILAVLSIMFVGCGKKNIEPQPQPTQSTNIDSPIIGVWRHQDVPELPHYKTWLIKINKDGTYTTESDLYDSDKGKISHTESFGDKGTFVLADDKILFRSDKGSSRTETFAIEKENNEERLVFKDSSGKNKSSVMVGGKTYDLIFIKQK